MLHRIDRRASGSELALGLGDELQIELGENPTTGYRWHVADAGDVLEETDAQYARAGTGVGAGGRRTLSFRAVRAGTGRLRLRLMRDEAATDRFEVTVHVLPKE